MHNWPLLSDIKTPTGNYDVTVLIGADISQLHSKKDTRIGKRNDRVTVKTTIGWVLMGWKNHLITNENINLD